MTSISSGGGGTVVQVNTDIPIVAGPFNDFASWLVGSGGPVDPPTSITSVSGGIRLQNAGWTVPPNDQVVFLGLGGDYTTAAGGVLQPFSLSLPFP